MPTTKPPRHESEGRQSAAEWIAAGTPAVGTEEDTDPGSTRGADALPRPEGPVLSGAGLAPPPPSRLMVTLQDLALHHTGQVMTEAPFSATAAVESPHGFQWLVTVRRGAEGGLEAAMATVETRLLEKGYKPQERRQGAAQGTATPGSTGAPAAVPTCKYHGAMKTSDKAPGTYYCSKKLADGSYCPSRYPEKGA